MATARTTNSWRKLQASILSVVLLFLLLPAVSLSAPASAGVPAAGFTVRPMSIAYDDPFSPSTSGNPVTDNGLVAGSTVVGRYERAAVYDLHRHTLTVLGTLGGRSSFGTDVNSAGDVVGWSETSVSGPTHAFVWTAKTGVMHDLQAFEGHGDSSVAYAINDAGIVAGSASFAPNPYTPRAVTWDSRAASVQARELPLPPGTDLSIARAVNARGQVVGEARRDQGDYGNEAFLWDPATARVREIPSPVGAQAVGAVDVNDDGVVIGPAVVTASGSSGGPRSYRWSPTTQASRLLIAPPGQSSGSEPGRPPSTSDQVRAINRHGIIVGVAERKGVLRLVVWNECGTPVFLQPARGGQGTSGNGVNRYAEIVGVSTASPTGAAEFVRTQPCTTTTGSRS